MHFSSPAILAVAVTSIALVEACPYASSSSSLAGSINNLPKNHPIVPNMKRQLQDEGEESLIGLDGRLVGSPSLDNGAADFPSLLVPIRKYGVTVADLVAGMSASMGEDMCLIRFQQLPPPESGNYSFDQNATDRLALKEYGDLMVQRFNDRSSPDLHMGAIVHASTTIGYGGIESMCNGGIEPERFCDETLFNGTSVRWPQAVTGYKLTNETVQAAKDAVQTWRTTEEGHLPSMIWSFLGGDPNSGGSQIGFWGNDGGLFSKIVKCSDIPTELMYYEYPDGIATGDYIDPTTNLTVSEMMYQWWTAYGGFDPETGEQVFGEAPKLPEECRPCVEAMFCFGGQGCNLLDLETGSWGTPFEACNPAIGCLECFPECIEEKIPVECEPCTEAAPCFDAMGCAALDFEAQTWATPYEDCGESIECLECFPLCKPEPELPPECVACAEAGPCFDEMGCGFFDSETKSWSAPFDTCGPALACVDLGCFPGCADAEPPMEDPTMAPVVANLTQAPVAAEPDATEAPAGDSGATDMTQAPVAAETDATEAPAGDSGATAMPFTVAIVLMMASCFVLL